MNASFFPRTWLRCIPNFSDSPVWAQVKRTGLLLVTLSSPQFYQTQITAQNAIPAQNVIRYSTAPFPQRLHYIYIRVCVLYVRVRVCVCDP